MEHRPHFVSMIDTFLSGWGPAEDKENLLIIECNNRQEAEIVRDNANNRTDTRRVSMTDSEPAHYHPRRKTDEHGGYVSGQYFVQIKTRADMGRWFEEGAF